MQESGRLDIHDVMNRYYVSVLARQAVMGEAVGCSPWHLMEKALLFLRTQTCVKCVLSLTPWPPQKRMMRAEAREKAEKEMAAAGK